MKNFILKTLKIFISGLIIGFLLMIGVYLIPTGRIVDNVEKSKEILKEEGHYHYIVSGDKTTMIDNYTDSIMLNEAMYHGDEGIIDKTMNVYKYYISNDLKPLDNLDGYFNNDPLLHPHRYTRYWHGYLIFVKPLLLFLNIAGIRQINAFLQLALIVSISVLFVKKKKEKYLIPYLITIFMTTPMTVGMCLQYSSIFYIMNIALLTILLFDDKIRSKNYYNYFFLIVGMVTSFFDFLTYPLATLGLPLILYFVYKNEKDIFNNIKDLIAKCFMWAFGYFGMWGSKLVIATILTGKDAFKEAFNHMNDRLSSEVQSFHFSRLDAVRKNLDIIINRPFIIVFLLGLIFIGYLFYKNRKDFNKNNLLKIVPFIIISIMPLVWIFMLSNHSYIHDFLEYRGLVIIVFAILCGLVLILGGENETKKKRK